MNIGRLIFFQLMDVVPHYQFRKIVARHKGDYRVRKFTCWNHLLCLCFGQLTFRESLRDLTATPQCVGFPAVSMGITTDVARNTFARANASRPWQMYHELAILLTDQARRLYQEDSDLEDVTESVYALDLTTIDLCLSLFPWAEFRSRKGAIKLHTLMDLEGAIPTFIHISDGRPHPLRRVHLIDKEHGQDIILLSNITNCSAEQIATYYKQRWSRNCGKLFFKWIKQHLRIKAFYGQNPNAVKTQIWTAICTYLIIIIIQKSNHFSVKLHTMMQVLSVAILQRMSLKQLFSNQSLIELEGQSRNQLGLFNF